MQASRAASGARSCCWPSSRPGAAPRAAGSRQAARRCSVQVQASIDSRGPSPRHQAQQRPLQQPGQQQHAAVEAAASPSREEQEPLLAAPLVSFASVAAVAIAVNAVPMLLPSAASASSVLATLVPHSLQVHHHSQTVIVGYTVLGAASLLTTLVCTSRFLVSFNPALEEEVELRRWALPWCAVTLFDPLLKPLRRGLFGQTEAGDLDYAAVALLAVICSLLECLVGKDGLSLNYIPSFALREALQYLIIFQHGLLLPCWVIVVLRWGRVL